MKRVLFFTSFILWASAFFIGYSNGPGQSDENRTGSGAAQASCSGPLGCHDGGSWVNIFTVTLSDTTGTTNYTTWEPGKKYKVLLSGTTTAPRMGFQLSSVYNNGTTNMQAGTYSNLPSNVHIATVGGLTILEHNQRHTGINVSFFWTAPSNNNIDTISFYTTVNGIDNTSGPLDDNSTNKVFKFGKSSVSINTSEKSNQFLTYPNPVINDWSIDTKVSGKLSIFNFDGKLVMKQDILQGVTHMNISRLPPSSYLYTFSGSNNIVIHGRFNKL